MLNSAIRFLSVLATVVLLHDSSNAADKKSPTPPRIRLTSAQARFVRGIERELVTRLNSKDNPGDRDTWYVLVLIDQAAAQRIGTSRSSSKLTIAAEFRASSKPQATVVQSKRSAALAVARFYASFNRAAPFAARSGLPTSRNATQFRAMKVWRYLAFEKEQDARAFLLRIMPKSRR